MRFVSPWLIVFGLTVGCNPELPVEKLDSSEPAHGYRLAFNVLEDESADDYEVYVMDLDGSRPRNISNNPAVDWAYVSDGGCLYAVSDRGSERRSYHNYEVCRIDDNWRWRQLSSFTVSDSWIGVRKGATGFVVASKKDGQQDLYLIDGDGEELRRLTDDPTADRDPAFSPDGRQIVWASSRGGFDELWIMDLDSGDARQLTHYPPELLPMEGHGYHVGPPAWEPSRGLISFCSKRQGVNSIFTVRPDGTDLQRITEGPFDRCWHSWSPDGGYLAFDGTDENGYYDIYLRDMSTGETVRLTEGPRSEQAPVFVAVGD